MEKEDNTFELIDETIKLHQLAVRKGFEQSNSIKPIFYEPNMPLAAIFCNTACAVITWWLRTEQNIILWIEPIESNRFKALADYGPKLGIVPNTKLSPWSNYSIPGEYLTYEGAWLAGLTFCLESLLDK